MTSNMLIIIHLMDPVLRIPRLTLQTMLYKACSINRIDTLSPVQRHLLLYYQYLTKLSVVLQFDNTTVNSKASDQLGNLNIPEQQVSNLGVYFYGGMKSLCLWYASYILCYCFYSVITFCIVEQPKSPWGGQPPFMTQREYMSLKGVP